MITRTSTHSSPYRFTGGAAAEYAASPTHQHALVMDALRVYFEDPFERSVDLRGHKFEVLVHDDGLHVTVRHLSTADD